MSSSKVSNEDYNQILDDVYVWRSKDRVDLIVALLDDCDEREVKQIAKTIDTSEAYVKPKRKVKKGTTKGKKIEAKVTGRCMKCKRQRRMVNVWLVQMNSNKAHATKGECSSCGTGMFRMGAPESYEAASNGSKSNGSKPSAKAKTNGSVPLRGKSGALRNFAQMGDAKLAEAVKASKGTKDTEARKAVLAAARDRR